jgi:phosphotransferase system HPr (HPr) family protein
MARRVLTVTNKHGLHARPAAAFVQAAGQFTSSITLRNLSRGTRTVNAKSIMQILTASVDCGSEIELIAEGDDAEQAVEALVQVISDHQE